MTKQVLKDCPFCGSKAMLDYLESLDEWRVSCWDCGCMTESYKNDDRVKHLWNKRVEDKQE